MAFFLWKNAVPFFGAGFCFFFSYLGFSYIRFCSETFLFIF